MDPYSFNDRKNYPLLVWFGATDVMFHKVWNTHVPLIGMNINQGWKLYGFDDRRKNPLWSGLGSVTNHTHVSAQWNTYIPSHDHKSGLKSYKYVRSTRGRSQGLG